MGPAPVVIQAIPMEVFTYIAKKGKQKEWEKQLEFTELLPICVYKKYCSCIDSIYRGLLRRIHGKDEN